jgi:hypothetical protein
MVQSAGSLKLRVFTSLLVAIAGGFLLCCYKAPSNSSSTSSSGGTTGGLPPSGVRFRAFVSQDIASSTATPGLDIVNATLDRLVRAPGVSAGNAPTFMRVSGNHRFTLVFDSSSNTIEVVSNQSETAAGKVALPGASESMTLPDDATVAFAAVPTATVAGQPAGAVEMLNLTNFSLEPPIPVNGARFIVLSPDGTHLLAFSNNQNQFTLVNLQNVGTANTPNWVVNGSPVAITGAGLDNPIWGVFTSDSKTAFILNCGAECGGSAAGVSVLDFSSGSPVLGATIAVPSATFGVLFGPTLYVAGSAPTPPGSNSCAPTSTAATSCGQLSVVDTAAQSVVRTLTITDGYHDRMGITTDNQVFIGAHNCMNVNIPEGEQRGCLSIYNSSKNTVTIGTDLGDVTGIQPVTGRTEVYVVQNGELRIWDTTTDVLLPPNLQINIIGQALDVKIPD